MEGFNQRLENVFSRTCSHIVWEEKNKTTVVPLCDLASIVDLILRLNGRKKKEKKKDKKRYWCRGYIKTETGR